MLLNVATDSARVIASADATPGVVQAIRARNGLDRPLAVRNLESLGGVLQGDFGITCFWQKPVAELVADRAGETITLAMSALAVTTGSRSRRTR